MRRGRRRGIKASQRSWLRQKHSNFQNNLLSCSLRSSSAPRCNRRVIDVRAASDGEAQHAAVNWQWFRSHGRHRLEVVSPWLPTDQRLDGRLSLPLDYLEDTSFRTTVLWAATNLPWHRVLSMNSRDPLHSLSLDAVKVVRFVVTSYLLGVLRESLKPYPGPCCVCPQ